MIQLDNAVERYGKIILTELKEAGIKCWIAGGALRDYFMAVKITTDYDLFFPNEIEYEKAKTFKIKDLDRNCINSSGFISSCETSPDFYYNPGLEQLFFKDQSNYRCLAVKNNKLTVDSCDFNSAAQRFQNYHKKMLIVNTAGCMTEKDKTVSFESCDDYNESQKFIISPNLDQKII